MLFIAGVVAFPMPLGAPVGQVVVQFGALKPGDSGTATVAAAAGEGIDGVGLGDFLLRRLGRIVLMQPVPVTAGGCALEFQHGVGPNGGLPVFGANLGDFRRGGHMGSGRQGGVECASWDGSLAVAGFPTVEEILTVLFSGVYQLDGGVGRFHGLDGLEVGVFGNSYATGLRGDRDNGGRVRWLCGCRPGQGPYGRPGMSFSYCRGGGRRR